MQLIRRVHCRGHRFRRPSIGRNSRPDSVQTTLQSETCCTGFHLSNEILGRASSRFGSDCRNSSMSRDGSEHLHSGCPLVRAEAEAVNCGNDHKTRNEAAAATPWGHSRANLNLLPEIWPEPEWPPALLTAAQSLRECSHPKTLRPAYEWESLRSSVISASTGELGVGRSRSRAWSSSRLSAASSSSRPSFAFRTVDFSTWIV